MWDVLHACAPRGAGVKRSARINLHWWWSSGGRPPENGGGNGGESTGGPESGKNTSATHTW